MQLNRKLSNSFNDLSPLKGKINEYNSIDKKYSKFRKIHHPKENKSGTDSCDA
jgi:hypothetical protein